MKKVLVLLSTYNGEKYLIDQINSLMSQKMVDVNVLVRDDGSTDSTVNILKKNMNKRIKCVFGTNLGASKSFFELINMATLDYDYYAFCDQDDVWLENKLEKALDKLECFDDYNPSLYYSGQILTDKELRTISNHVLDVNRSIKANWIFNQMAGCTAVFNKRLLELMKQYIPKKIKYHDVWCYKLCACFDGNIYVDSNGYILYRQHEDNVIGMNSGLRGKFNRAYKYIFLYKCSDFAEEILNGYKDQLSDKWVHFLGNIISSNTTSSNRYELISDKEICFNSAFLKILFFIKVMLKKI